MKRSWRVELGAVVRKEVIQTLRDRRIMFMLIVAPLLQTVMFGFAIDFHFDHIPTAVVDGDRTPTTRAHARRLLADKTLERLATFADPAEAAAWMEKGQAAATVVFPRNFARDTLAGRGAEVQVLLDGTDPNRAMMVANTVARYFAQATPPPAPPPGTPPLPRLRAEPTMLWNPGLLTSPFMIPGVISMLLVITTTITTAMGLSREREMGTLEQVQVTPIRPQVLLLGKMVPFLVIGFFDLFLVLVVGMTVFHVPVLGSLSLLGLGTMLYLLSTLGLGLLISTISKTQQQSFLAGFLFAMPAILLSGVMTPIRAMPTWLQHATQINPVRHYIELSRAILLKGATFVDLWPTFATLAGLGLVLFVGATWRFQKRSA
jgi:ABC-2 type transport system permease protein